MSDTAPGIGSQRWYERLVQGRLRRLESNGAEPRELLEAIGSETRRERAVRTGRDGELEVGTILNIWCGRHGLGLLHDVKLPGGWANVDHLVVGPSGVTVVDAKKWAGDVWIRQGKLRNGPYNRRRVLDGVRAQVDHVREALRRAELDSVPVRGVVALANENPGCPRRALVLVDGVLVGWPETAAKLAASEGPIGVRVASAACRELEAAYRVRGGTRPPGPAFHGGPAAEVRAAWRRVASPG